MIIDDDGVGYEICVLSYVSLKCVDTWESVTLVCTLLNACKLTKACAEEFQKTYIPFPASTIAESRKAGGWGGWAIIYSWKSVLQWKNEGTLHAVIAIGHFTYKPVLGDRSDPISSVNVCTMWFKNMSLEKIDFRTSWSQPDLNWGSKVWWLATAEPPLPQEGACAAENRAAIGFLWERTQTRCNVTTDCKGLKSRSNQPHALCHWKRCQNGRTLRTAYTGTVWWHALLKALRQPFFCPHSFLSFASCFFMDRTATLRIFQAHHDLGKLGTEAVCDRSHSAACSPSAKTKRFEWMIASVFPCHGLCVGCLHDST